MPVDGPYIFLKNGEAESYYVMIGNAAQQPEIKKEVIPLSVLPDKSFTCPVDNSGATQPVDSFEFRISSDESFSNHQWEYELPEKLIVLSDIEGNFYALQAILRAHNVIDSTGNWTYGNNHLLLLGDLIDRGKNVIACLWLIYKLEAQAKKQGGCVHYLLGNHEWMNFNGDFRYVHDKYIFLNQNLQPDYAALFDSSSLLGNWIRSKNTIEKIGDYLFVHAGISGALVQQRFSVPEINNTIKNNLGKHPDEISDRREEMLFSEQGPLWYRGLVYRQQHTAMVTEEEVADILQYFKAKKMVVGHSVVPFFKKLYRGKVIAIDIIQPEAKNKNPVRALLIEGGKEYILDDSSLKGTFL